MFCSKCGNKVSNYDVFCFKCGVKIQKESDYQPEVSGVNIEKSGSQNVAYQNNINSTYSTNSQYSSYQPILNYKAKNKNENNIVFVVLTAIVGFFSLIMSFCHFLFEYQNIIYFFVCFLVLIYIISAINNNNELRITKIVFLVLFTIYLIIELIDNIISLYQFYERNNIQLEFGFNLLSPIIIIVFFVFSIIYLLSKNKSIKIISIIFSVFTFAFSVIYDINIIILYEYKSFYNFLCFDFALLTILFGNLASYQYKKA